MPLISLMMAELIKNNDYPVTDTDERPRTIICFFPDPLRVRICGRD